MKSDKEILESLVAGGFIGATIGALLFKEKGKGALLGAIAGAAIIATYKAHEQALKTNIPMFIEENGNLYYIKEDRTKEFVKKLDKPVKKLPKKFKLK